MEGSLESSHNDVTLKTRMVALFQMLCQAVSRPHYGGLDTLVFIHFEDLSWRLADLTVFWIFRIFPGPFRIDGP